MKKLILIVVLSAGLGGISLQAYQALANPPSEDLEISTEKSANNHIIEIHKMKFQTKALNVEIGDTVTWVNKDIVPHTVTANDKSWDSGKLTKGESFTLTINSQTSLDYFCFYHRQMTAALAVKQNEGAD